jgi:GDP-D-mannose 3', 5'-epimerase
MACRQLVAKADWGSNGLSDLVLVAGGGGFIGGHLIRALMENGNTVRAIDHKPLEHWHQMHPTAENVVADLKDLGACRSAVAGVGKVYNLACDMGGMGFIESHKAECMLSVLINTHLLMAAREAGAERYFFASSACVYAAGKQSDAAVTALREEDAYPAMPEDGYGWEKLFSERMCRHFSEDFGLATRIGRYHNVYGPFGTWNGGREKAPAALCRKFAEAKLLGNATIEIWGDGEQTRSFTYIDDCLVGTAKLIQSSCAEPLNIGSSELVSVNQLADLIQEIAGIRPARRFNLDAPQGVRGRNSDNRRIREELNWEPSISLRNGLEQTYSWIYQELKKGLSV